MSGSEYNRILSSSSDIEIIVQMFEWTWDSVAAECHEFLGPAGYGYVQVSPAAEHVTGSEWSSDYSPVSYTLTSKHGNRDQYQNMVRTCQAAGVGVIQDTIFNHMSGSGIRVGVGGSNYTHYVYPGIYQYQDFHHCGLEPGDNIVDYSNRIEVQTCQLDTLADLATETEWVRAKLTWYANDLISLGVTGLRLDAAKHIAADDISNITSRLSKKVYITQEVTYDLGSPILPDEYIKNGDVQEFRYTKKLKSAFSSTGIAGLKGAEDDGWLSSAVANVFVSNHDTERSGDSLNYQSSSNMYTLAMVFSLSYPYGTPTILSSFSFSQRSDGPPNGGAGTCSGSNGAGGWLCQHRWAAVAGMVPFFNAAQGTALVNWQNGSAQQIAFGRGSIGFVIINNDGAPWVNTFATSVPTGLYCNVIAGPYSSGTCTGASYAVTGGTLTTTVPSRSAIAIYTGALAKSVVVNMKEVATTTPGEASCSNAYKSDLPDMLRL
ncbi:alpha-amylase [Ceratobasidium sp. AG-Ba]|nr:alpha-amylase [Ceratobasidium sp. AG-Ba]